VRACNYDDVDAIRCDVTDVTITYVDDFTDNVSALLVEPPYYDGGVDGNYGNRSADGVELLPGDNGLLAGENVLELALFSNTNVVIIVAIGSAVIGVTVVVVTLAVCVAVTRSSRSKQSHKYNCRLETDRAVSSLSLDGAKTKFHGDSLLAAGDSVRVGEDSKQNSFNTFGVTKYNNKNRKGVTFHLNDKLNISAPITDTKLSCPVSSSVSCYIDI